LSYDVLSFDIGSTTVTRSPSRRRVRTQRGAATASPARVLDPGGVIMTMFMDTIVSERPTSGAGATELVAQQTRVRTHRLTDELSSEQLMGVKLDIIVNSVLSRSPPAAGR
jgi:hypothetical protein